jgi:thiol-disulfide isomerase/thioredoxin
MSEGNGLARLISLALRAVIRPHCCKFMFLIALVDIVGSARGDDAKSPPAPWRISLEETGKKVADKVGLGLQSAWKDPPESVAMLADILRGSQLGPGEGWFRKAVAQTRFDWKTTAERLDRNHDGKIVPEEYPGARADFGRLDRDHDDVLTKQDFDFSGHALSPSPGAMLFVMADRDGNGKLTRQEFDQFFEKSDSGGSGFLSLGDLQEALPMPTRSRSGSGGSEGPSIVTLLKGLARQEIGSLQPGPRVGEVAPDFTLKTIDGKQEITLSKLVGPKPVVLVFGNFTCGPFRTQAGNIEKLYKRYHDRVTFVMVYVREAHPLGGWQLDSNNRLGVRIEQPRSYDERVGVAQVCGKRLGLGLPMVVDTIGDTVGARYSGMPSRLYLVDERGRVAYKSGRGPFGFKPSELEHSLILLLQQDFPELKGKAEPSSSSAVLILRDASNPPVASAGSPR